MRQLQQLKSSSLMSYSTNWGYHLLKAKIKKEKVGKESRFKIFFSSAMIIFS